jgi:hypothetical protein
MDAHPAGSCTVLHRSADSPVRLVDEDRREVGAHVFDANGLACCVLRDDSRDGLDIDIVIRLDGFAP